LSNKKLPDYRLKQKILYVDNTSTDVLRNFGNLFLEEGCVSDALDFYLKAKHVEGIQKIKEMALNTGDVMLFQRAAKSLNMEIKQADWEIISQKAISLKKYGFAKYALEKANNQEDLNYILKIMEAGYHGKDT
jgi:capsule polysaccharide modification protein KpsS